MSEMNQAAAAPGGGLLGWYKELDTKERRTLKACVGGWALDAMDAQLYAFVIPALISVWGISRGEAGQLQTAALLTSAAGGWLAGYLADRIGRVRTLQLAILWFAGFTFLSGLAQDYTQLFICRALMGFGFGGEWAAGAVLLGETIRAEHRGKALGSMQAGWAVGWAAAAILSTLAFQAMAPDTAWRVLFMIGIVPALLVFVIRRFIDDSEVYQKSQARIRAGIEARPNFWEIFQGPLLRTTLLGAVMGTGAQGGYWAVTTWLPTFLRTPVDQGGRGLGILNTGGYLTVLIAASFVGYMTGAYLADRIGRRSTFLFFALGACVVVLTYTMVPFGDGAMLVLGAPLGFFASGVFSAMGAFFTEQFPTRVRGVGQGFAYNFGRATGAFFPLFVGLLSGSIGLGPAIGIFAASAYAIMAVAAFALPETKGKVLTA